MCDPARLALAIPNTCPEPSPAGLALVAGLACRGWRVQHFSSRARPVANDAVGQATGLPGRHLDPWLMQPPICREIFLRGARSADLAVVEGTYDADDYFANPSLRDRPGRLGPIAEALGLPIVAVVSIDRDEAFHLPPLPPNVDAILLDHLPDAESYPTLRRVVELLSRKPVIGAIEGLPEARRALLAGPSADPRLVAGAIDRLGASFLNFADLDAVQTLGKSRPLPGRIEDRLPAGHPRRFRVAYAMDAAFGGYFPDTLETLEALGADLVEFSPLCDESLPEGADLVMIGCGVPDRHADDLAANLSLISALRAHVCRGRRIYSEGGGTAYLGRSMLLNGRRVPGAGILPFDAELRAHPTDPFPVTRTFLRDGGWLGPEGTTVRGYRSGRWHLRPAPEPGDCPARSGSLTAQSDLIFRNNAIGSLVHLHLASLPEVVAAFAGSPREAVLPRR